MPRQIPIDDIIDGILAGIRKAHSDYQKWSDGEWLDCAPEYLMTTYIARSVFALPGPKYLTLESNVGRAMKDAGHTCRGRLPSRLRATGRVDIQLWWGHGSRPRAVIEVKRWVGSFSGCDDDVSRIARMISKKATGSSYQFGVVAFYISFDDGVRKLASDMIENRLKTILSGARESVSSLAEVELERLQTRTDGEGAWSAACLVLYPKP